MLLLHVEALTATVLEKPLKLGLRDVLEMCILFAICDFDIVLFFDLWIVLRLGPGIEIEVC